MKRGLSDLSFVVEKISGFGYSFFDFFFPGKCLCCGNYYSYKELPVCTSCLNGLIRTDESCLADIKSRTFYRKSSPDGLFSAYLFEKDTHIQTLLHKIKYSGYFRAGTTIGRHIGSEFGRLIAQFNADEIIPVPLHRLKYSERGYNQSYHIAVGLSRIIGVPVNKRGIKRIIHTKSQTGMTAKERVQNVKGAFTLSKNYNPEGKTIILLDDVITTGSTINECSRILKENGAAKVFAVSVAIVP
ncbi:MAG: ComF family protein [Ignavibacteriales bacterium]|nr:ComF family protein [Ignavibacteriales bacterium]MCF8307045.1 ComF family protein [Ignavibacteriales bacterium]MCF8316668.1 ComF family protein [Ignavibacteriales bacterium]MCF8438324.1 ComF family protein [Ignavibacteriales bacterium]